MRSPSAHPRRRLVAAAVGLVCAFAVSSSADVFVLKDGTSVDGRALREDGGFVWVKTLTGTEKLKLEDVAERTPGESPVDVYDRLTAAVKDDPKSAAAHWDLCRFLRENAGDDKTLNKEADKLLQKVLKLAPDHEEARAANGDVRFKSQWVRAADLPRLQAEEARKELRQEWTRKLSTTVDVYATDHFLLVDGTNDKDLAQRAESLEEAYAQICEMTGREQLWSEPSPTITLRDHETYLPVLETMSKAWGMSEEWMKFARLETGGGVWRDRPVPTQLRFPNRGVEGMWYSCVHMVGHLAIWKIWGGNRKPPTWLEEGLGQWIEMKVMGEHLASCVGGKTDKGAGGTSDQGKKKKGKKGSKEEIDMRKEACIEAVQDGSFPAMRQFLRMQIGDYGPAEEGGAYGLVTWLASKGDEKFAEIVRELVVGGRRDDDPWTRVFQYELIEEMEKDWKTWVLTEW